MISRSEFIRNAGAFAALPLMPGLASAATSRPELVIGILSDIHLQMPPRGNAATIDRFRHALEYFRSREVDGVLIAGDLANAGLETELEAVAKTWFEVFPEGKLPNGNKVANLMHYGDHDAETRFYTPALKAQFAKAGMPVPRSLSEGENRKEIWERLFHEPWSPIRHVRVKGYDFVLSNYMREGASSAPKDLEAQLRAMNLDPVKPFFYSQHRWIKGTYLTDEEMWGPDNGVTFGVLRKFPNAVAFQGHTHYTLTDDRSLWIGDFASVNCGSLLTQSVARKRENGTAISWYKNDYMMEKQMRCVNEHQSHCGMVMNVYGDRIVLERREFVSDLPLGPELSFSTDLRKRQEERDEKRRERSVAPEFTTGALAKVSKRKGKDRRGRKVDQVVVSFPAVKAANGRPRALDYVVRAERDDGATVCEKRVFSPAITLPEALDGGPVECVFSQAEVVSAAKFSVAPANCWGKAGQFITL